MALFKKPKYTTVKVTRRKGIPDGLWVRCEDCGQIIYKKTLLENYSVCPKCNYHFTLGAYERISLFVDKGSFKEEDKGIISKDPLNFKAYKSYQEKLKKDQEATGLTEAVVTGKALVGEKEVAIGVTDSRFIMGSMGSVVGEKITNAIERATSQRLPLIIISGSGGGARMYEGILSLMQMAKTSSALARHNAAGLLYLSVLTNPTMAGVMASFASLGDVVIAEPRALIGFTGPRVIEQTIREKLPEGFQRSEFLLERGFIDIVIHRKDLRIRIIQILDYLRG